VVAAPKRRPFSSITTAKAVALQRSMPATPVGARNTRAPSKVRPVFDQFTAPTSRSLPSAISCRPARSAISLPSPGGDEVQIALVEIEHVHRRRRSVRLRAEDAAVLQLEHHGQIRVRDRRAHRSASEGA
jgi:hypothetical protein